MRQFLERYRPCRTLTCSLSETGRCDRSFSRSHILWGIADRVTFLAWRNDIAALLKASHLYVHSTTSDGFGMAACEAMAAGLPILASNDPGLAQVVEGAGVLFPVLGNENMLARELTALIQSPDRRLKMSQASRQRAQQFSIDRTVDACIQMYVSVLGVSPPTLARHYDQRRC